MLVKTSIHFGHEQNSNGRIYPKSVVKQMADTINKSPIPIVPFEFPMELKTYKVLGHCIEAHHNEYDNVLNIRCELLENYSEDFLKYIAIVPNGIGDIVNGEITDDYKLISFSIIPKHDSSFKIS
jgi:hypothetical protein